MPPPLQAESKVSSEVVGLCQGVLHLETYRNRTAEAKASDSNIISLLQKCEESCLLQEQRSSSVTDIEQQIMSHKDTPPVEKVDASWLKKTLDAIKQEVKLSYDTLDSHKTALNDAQDKITQRYEEMRSVINSHHKLMLDVRKILVSLDKYERQDSGEDMPTGGISEWLLKYREFCENINATNKLFSDELGDDNIALITGMLRLLKANTPGIYDDLVSFASPLVTDNTQEDTKDSLSVGDKKVDGVMKRSVDTESMSPQTITKPTPGSIKKTDKITRDPRTGKAMQERNAYAVGVWRRVKMKLDGRDPDNNKRLTVQEQVDYVLREATSQDNLSVLYEGWTPWV